MSLPLIEINYDVNYDAYITMSYSICLLPRALVPSGLLARDLDVPLGLTE